MRTTTAFLIAVALLASLLCFATALADLPADQIGSSGIYIQFDSILDNIDQEHGYPVSGGHMRWEWKDLEPEFDDDYRFEEKVRPFVSDQASRGKKAAIGFETYVGRFSAGEYGPLAVPAWLYRTHAGTIQWNTVSGQWYVLDFLDSAYQQEYAEFIFAFADWLAANPDLTANVGWVEIGVGLDAETQPADSASSSSKWTDYLYYDQHALGGELPPGWTGNDWLGYVNWCTDTYYHAFRVRNPSLFHIPLFLNCAPEFKSTRTAFTDYAAGKGIGLKNNGLMADRAPASLYGPLEKWGAPWASETAPIGWETYPIWLSDETKLYWGVLCALDKYPDILEPTRDLMIDSGKHIIPNYVAIWEWADQYVGVDATTTPGMFCALRDTEFSNGEPGNYEFYLFQRDDYAPGGSTKPAFHVTSGREGRYTRRTDEATGNRYMFFKVFNPCVYGNPNRIPFTVTVTYLDRGTDTWQLSYDSFSGEKSAGLVSKTNSETWKKQAFVLDDARFQDSLAGGTDLRLDSNGDGDEFIHLIEITKGTAAATPTLTPGTAWLYLPLIVKKYGTGALQNGGFESGDLTGWRHGGTLMHGVVAEGAHGGVYAALLGDPDAEPCEAPTGEAWIEQEFSVLDAPGAHLSLWYRLVTYDLSRELADTIDHFDVWLNGERVLRDANQTFENTCEGPPHDLGWKRWQCDLSPYSGRVLTLKVVLASTDHWWNTWVWLDDVEVLEAGPGPMPTLTAASAPTPTATPTAIPTPSPTPTIEPGATRVHEPTGITLVYVPGGAFSMGSREDDPDAYSNEKPQHTVYVDSFWIAQTEVSHEQYGRFIDAGGYTQEAYWSVAGWQWREANNFRQPWYWGNSTWNGAQQPVVGVTWYEADAYARWAGCRLPTEAEWEYAARGGPLSEGFRYAGSNEVGKVAWYWGNASDVTHWVGQKWPNELGLYDMSGNVWEWCVDWYDANYYAASPVTNPQGPTIGAYRAIRSGSWYSRDQRDLRCACRYAYDPEFRFNYVGFRLVE